MHRGPANYCLACRTRRGVAPPGLACSSSHTKPRVGGGIPVCSAERPKASPACPFTAAHCRGQQLGDVGPEYGTRAAAGVPHWLPKGSGVVRRSQPIFGQPGSVPASGSRGRGKKAAAARSFKLPAACAAAAMIAQARHSGDTHGSTQPRLAGGATQPSHWRSTKGSEKVQRVPTGAQRLRLTLRHVHSLSVNGPAAQKQTQQEACNKQRISPSDSSEQARGIKPGRFGKGTPAGVAGRAWQMPGAGGISGPSLTRQGWLGSSRAATHRPGLL